MLKLKLIKVTQCFVLPVAAFVITCGFVIKVNKVADSLQSEKTADKPLLNKFELLCKKIGRVNGNYTLGGIINIDDKASTETNMKNIQFLFCKQGDEFYYKLGNTVTLNEQGV